MLTSGGRSEPEADALLLYSLVEGTIQQYLLDPANYPLDIVAGRIISQFTAPEEKAEFAGDHAN